MTAARMMWQKKPQEHTSQDGRVAGTPGMNASEHDDIDFMAVHSKEVDILSNPTRRLGDKVLFATEKRMGFQQSTTVRGYADLGEAKRGVTADTVHRVVHSYADMNQRCLKGVEIWPQEWSIALEQDSRRPTVIKPEGSSKGLFCYDRLTWKGFWDEDAEVNPFKNSKAEQVVIITSDDKGS